MQHANNKEGNIIRNLLQLIALNRRSFSWLLSGSVEEKGHVLNKTLSLVKECYSNSVL